MNAANVAAFLFKTLHQKYKRMRIITLTLNPAIDKSTTAPAFVPEKKLRCTTPVIEAGGGGINVARVLKRLGIDAGCMYLSGGFNGTLLQQLLERENILTMPVDIKNDTRENMVVYDAAADLQYRFCMPGPQVAENEWQQCLQQIDAMQQVQYIVASGSMPPGVPDNFFSLLAAMAKKKNAKLVADTSGGALKAAVNEGVYLLKPNLGELSALTGIAELNMKSVHKVAKEIINNGGCEVMIVSMGAAGALLITKEIQQQISTPPVKRKSTVGAGDSMIAGIVYSLVANKTIIEAAQFGVACGTAATMNAGTALCKPSDALKLFEEIKEQL